MSRSSRLVAVLSAAALVAGLATVTAAPVLAVDPIVVNSLGDGAAVDGKCTLREALAAANSDTSSGGVTGECVATAGTNAITFSVAGTITALAGWPGISADLTIDGGGVVTLDGGGTHRLLVVSGGTTIVQGLAFRNGSSFEGSAIGVLGGSLNVIDSTFTDNDAADVGGAIEFVSGTGRLTVTGSTFTNNSAATEGGAIYKAGLGTVSIVDSTFTGNTITGADTVGGAISIHGVTTAIDGSTFTGNEQAIALFQTVATITDVVVASNTADSCPGIRLAGTGSTIVHTTIRDNVATAGAGGGVCITKFDVSDSQVTIRSSTISGNSADAGAGIIATNGTTTIANSTIANNTATGNSGGGLLVSGFIDNATLNIYNSTITGNSAPPPANGQTFYGGVAIPVDTFGEIVNTIITGNTNGDLQLDGDNVGFTADANLVGAQGAGVLDPRGLRDNGGPTKTVGLLATATAAIDQGNASVCSIKLINGVDQRDRSRTVDPCDIGAVEREKVAPAVTTAPVLAFREGVRLDGTSSRARLTWSGGADDVNGTGLDHFVVQRSTDGGAFTTIGSPTTAALNVTLGKDRTYRFRVAAVDRDGNASAFTAGPTVTARLYQQGNSRFTYRGTWTSVSKSSFSGGSARYATASGASATFTASGRGFAFISTIGPKRGKVKVFVDGSFVRTIDLRASSTSYRRQVFVVSFPTAGTHTIKVVVSGTTGRPRIDADAFAVIR